MPYLVAAIICSSLIAVLFRLSETRMLNRFAVTAFNYLGAMIVAALLLSSDLPERSSQELSFSESIGRVFVGNNGVFQGMHSVYWAITVGLPAGVFFFLAFVFYQKSIGHGTISLAGAFSKLGILVPMSLAIILWRELPSSIQWTGIVMALIAIIVIYRPFRADIDRSKVMPLAFLFLFGGIAEFSNKFFQHYSVSGYRSVFLLCVFSSAFLISSMVLIVSRKRFGFREVLTGLMIGVPNLFSSFFLIMSLEVMKSTVVFPLYSAGSVALITIWGVVVFSEKLFRSEAFALSLILLSLVLVNL